MKNCSMLVVIFVVFIFPLSCNGVEVVYYIHEPTEYFHKDYNFDDAKIKEFKNDEIVFFPDIRAATHTDNWVRIGFYSLSKAKKVKINKAAIFNPENNYKETIILNQLYMLDDNDASGSIYSKVVMLFNFNNETLYKLTGNEITVLKVTYEVNNKEAETIEFQMKRRVDKYSEFLDR